MSAALGRLLLLATALGGVGTFAARLFALRLGIVNAPNPIVPQHVRPVAYLGGVGVALGMFATMALSSHLGVTASLPLAVWLPALLFLALGAADDIWTFAPVQKLIGQALLAGLAVGLGLRAAVTGIAWLDIVLTTVWVLVGVNAFNLTDVCDGLVGGLSVPVFVALASLHPPHAPVALAIAGACLGFLAFNRPPASIFLGDAGSHLLGFLATALTATPATIAPDAYVLSRVLLLGAFLFELTFLVIVRAHKGLAWWRGSPDHFALRLQAAGLSKGQTSSLAVGIGCALAALSVALPGLPAAGRLAVAGASLLSALGVGCLLLRWEVRR